VNVIVYTEAMESIPLHISFGAVSLQWIIYSVLMNAASASESILGFLTGQTVEKWQSGEPQAL
jgi:hypothetical protein